jgi:hypothetical protein
MLVAVLLCLVSGSSAFAQTSTPPASGDLTGAVTDSSTGLGVQSIEVAVTRDRQLVARTSTDQFGHYVIHAIPAGAYVLQARLIGYRQSSQSITIEGGGTATTDIVMVPTPLRLEDVKVTAQAPVAVDTRTGNQTFRRDSYHGAPTNMTSQIIQQSIAGAARAPSGEVHIRGQHAEYTYYIDGVPVLPGISGSLNEIFDPAVVDQAEFQTGGWDAEYGGKNAAIVNVSTRIPAGGFRSEVSGFGGSFGTNGQGLSLSNSKGKWGWLATGTRQETDMRQEPVVADPSTTEAINFHNDGTDYATFGKAQFTPSSHDVAVLDVGWSQTKFAVPYDSTGGVALDDHQKDTNGFLNLGWRHQFSGGGKPGASSDLFASVFARHGSLEYTPGATSDPSFIFFPDSNLYNLSEDRSFETYGTKIDFRVRKSHDVEFKFGTLSSVTTGHEDFLTTAADGSHGPASSSNLDGHDIGLYAQTAFSPKEWAELRAGVRYDSHTAPFAGTEDQVSPRVKLTFFGGPSLTAYAYYGRQFLPTNIEDLRSITSAADSDVVALPTLPERDDFYEVAVIRRFPFGTVLKVSGYVKHSDPGIDDNTVPGSAITTSVNLDEVKVHGIETVLEVRPPGRVSGYINAALNHAYGRGPVTGGFFPTDPADVPGGWFDLDHDQRLSMVASAVYSVNQGYVSATGIYGSGLTNGADITEPIGTGLFDFNKDIHVDPNFILNASAGYSFVVGNTALRPSIYVDNVFDNNYLLKGAFFSGASVGRPRSVQIRLSVQI